MTQHNLSHLDESGSARMVDVTEKAVTVRQARAGGRVRMAPETLDLVKRNALAKGDVLAVARLAGIMAAKRTYELIPLCHGLALSGVDVGFALDEDSSSIDITAHVRIEGKTGVEMEALTAVSVAALTIYDMCKAVDRSMVLSDIRLLEKTGGRSGTYRRPDD